ncbi:MAG: T9SS type A sorting domain-containing protein [Bacteroidetes bacterium]|nr:T9SS type A sorting domain-containing protein [Bacteroidota bacterium]
MKKLIIFLFVITAAQLSYSQVTLEWAATYSNFGDYVAIDAALDSSGNIYVTGMGNGSNNKPDYVTIKYNSSGVREWIARYTGLLSASDDRPCGIEVDSFGNIYVSGTSGIYGTAVDFATVKYNSSGEQQWAIRYEGPSRGNIAVSMTSDSQDNLYVCGQSNSLVPTTDYVVVKYNSAGIQQWEARYTGGGISDYNVPKAFTLDHVGNIYIVGYGGGKCITVKINSSGNFQWATRFGINNNNGPATSIITDDSSNVYITGWYVIKYNTMGVEQWSTRFVDAAASSVIDAFGNLVVTGYVTGDVFPWVNTDILTRKYNTAGDSVWSVRYSNPLFREDDGGGGIIKDNFGNFYVSGTSRNNDPGDCITIKYNSSGQQLWTARYIDNLNNTREYPVSFFLDRFQNVFILGNTVSTFSSYFLVKYSQSVGINNLSNNIPAKFTLYQNYPNPFNPTTKVKFDIPKLSDVNIIIFDAIGREIKNVSQNNLNAGSYEYKFNGENLSSGIYYLKLNAGEFSKTVKMILMK